MCPPLLFTPTHTDHRPSMAPDLEAAARVGGVGEHRAHGARQAVPAAAWPASGRRLEIDLGTLSMDVQVRQMALRGHAMCSQW